MRSRTGRDGASGRKVSEAAETSMNGTSMWAISVGSVGGRRGRAGSGLALVVDGDLVAVQGKPLRHLPLGVVAERLEGQLLAVRPRIVVIAQRPGGGQARRRLADVLRG